MRGARRKWACETIDNWRKTETWKQMFLVESFLSLEVEFGKDFWVDSFLPGSRSFWFDARRDRGSSWSLYRIGLNQKWTQNFIIQLASPSCSWSCSSLNFFSLLGFSQDGKEFGLLHLAAVNPTVEHKSTRAPPWAWHPRAWSSTKWGQRSLAHWGSDELQQN